MLLLQWRKDGEPDETAVCQHRPEPYQEHTMNQLLQTDLWRLEQCHCRYKFPSASIVA